MEEIELILFFKSCIIQIFVHQACMNSLFTQSNKLNHTSCILQIVRATLLVFLQKETNTAFSCLLFLDAASQHILMPFTIEKLHLVGGESLKLLVKLLFYKKRSS